MANSVHTVICPYYITEFNNCITCEDVRRSFKSHDNKDSWMGMYCDSWDWMRCPYAVDLTEAYYRQEKGDTEALDKNQNEALKKELNNLAKRLGRCEKRNERLHKKIEELRTINQTLTQNNINLGDMNKKYLKRWKDERAQFEDYQKHEAERYFQMAMLYEDRIAYLIDKYCGGRLAETDVKAWAEGKEYALTFDKESKDPIWIVKTREETEADEDVSKPVQRASKNERAAVEK